MKTVIKSIYFVFVLVLFFVAFPILLITSLCLLLFSGLPIVYHQKRVGKSGAVFTMYKFRTMRLDADREKKSLLSRNEAAGPIFKIYNDPRLTPVGRFLNHTGLDELPQIINVIKGDMALIGPRPLPIAEAKQLKPWQQKRHQIKPGIISPWIFEGYHTKSFSEWMKSDIRYTSQKSLSIDTVLLIQALWLLLRLVTKESVKVIARGYYLFRRLI